MPAAAAPRMVTTSGDREGGRGRASLSLRWVGGHYVRCSGLRGRDAHGRDEQLSQSWGQTVTASAHFALDENRCLTPVLALRRHVGVKFARGRNEELHRRRRAPRR